MSKKIHIQSLVLAMITASMTVAASQGIASEKPPAEKCYGIVKKGMNDCAGRDHL